MKHLRRERCSHRVAVVLLLLAVTAAALKQGAAAAQCTQYKPTSCWFALPEDPRKEPVVFPRCAFHDCEFDHAAALKCPFAGSGTFSAADDADCPDFMQVEDRELPDCETACCGGWQPGSWVNSTSDSAAKHYRADESKALCQYFDYRRAEVVEKLLSAGIDIVVAGDSMMRQNYLRLVQMMRGRRRVFDYRVHTHASYDYCDEADAFRTASYLNDMKQPEKKYLIDVVPEFFARNDPNKAKSLNACSRTHGRIDFLHAPLFATHGKVLAKYVATAAKANRKLIVLSYVGVWTKVSDIPSHYFQSLQKVFKHGPGAAVIVISVPTFKEIRVPERAAKYRKRNRLMREWVEQFPGQAGFLDFESLTLAPNRPPNTVHDKHYMCYVTWPQDAKGVSDQSLRSRMMEVNSFRERLYDNPVGHVWMTEDGQCYDEMNRNLWAIALNTIMNAETGGNTVELPHEFMSIPGPIYAHNATMLSDRSKGAQAGGRSGGKGSKKKGSGDGAAKYSSKSGSNSGGNAASSGSSSSGSDHRSSSGGGGGSSNSSSYVDGSGGGVATGSATYQASDRGADRSQIDNELAGNDSSASGTDGSSSTDSSSTDEVAGSSAGSGSDSGSTDNAADDGNDAADNSTADEAADSVDLVDDTATEDDSDAEASDLDDAYPAADDGSGAVGAAGVVVGASLQDSAPNGDVADSSALPDTVQEEPVEDDGIADVVSAAKEDKPELLIIDAESAPLEIEE